MKYRKGWFRIWVVCAVLWALHVMYDSERDINYLFEYSFDRAKLVEIEKNRVEAKLQEALERKETNDYERNRLAKLGIPQNEYGRILDEEVEFDITLLQMLLEDPESISVEKPDMYWMVKAFLFPVIFPVLAFLAGLSVIGIIKWIKTGFLGESKSSVSQTNESMKIEEGRGNPLKKFAHWYKTAFLTYFNVHGRAGGGEYWSFIFGNIILYIAAIGFFVLAAIYRVPEGIALVGGFLCGGSMLIIFIPTFTVTVRRLHDIGKSGLWMIIPVVFQFISLREESLRLDDVTVSIFFLLSIVVSMWFIFWLTKKGQEGPNKYGPGCQ